MSRNALIFLALLGIAMLIATAAGRPRRTPPPHATVTPSPSSAPTSPAGTSAPAQRERDVDTARQPLETDPPAASAGGDTAPAARSSAPVTPRAVVVAFAAQTINWNWRTVARQHDRLAALASRQLGAVIARNQRLARRDETLARDRAGNRGQVIAADVSGRGSTRRAVAVTREISYSGGAEPLAGATHRVYLARLQHTRQGWRVDRWEPAP